MELVHAPLTDFTVATDKLPADMTYEELIEARENAAYKVEHAQAEMTVFNQELLERLKTEKLSGKVVGDYALSRCSRLSFQVDLKMAEELGATKPTIDQAKLKALYQKGIELPVTKSEYIRVNLIKKE